jgi:transposase
MSKRHEPSDAQWALIAPLMPSQRAGGAWSDHRTVVNGMFWKLCTGAPWRDRPERYGAWQTVYSRFRRWSREGLFAEILRRLHLRLAADGNLDYQTWLADGTNIRANRAAGGAKKGAATRPSATAEAASARRSICSRTLWARRSPRS